MIKLNIVIADNDDLHMRRLVNYLTDENKQLKICSFTEKESFIKYLEESSQRINILLFSEDMYSEEVRNKKADLKMKLTDGGVAVDSEYKSISKYQKADDFIHEVLVAFSEETGSTDAFNTADSDNAKIISVYSPVGGCGKTVIALAVSKILSMMGRQVLYLNFEGVSSVGNVLHGMGMHNMSEVLLAAKDKHSKLGVKIIQCEEVHPETGIHFINMQECAAEFSEMTPAELKKIAVEAKEIGQYDYIVIDMNSAYCDDVFSVLDVSYKILVPYLLTKSSVYKMNVYADELEKLERLEIIEDRMVLIENMSSVNSYHEFGRLQVQANIPAVAELADIDELLYNNLEFLVDTVFRII